MMIIVPVMLTAMIRSEMPGPSTERMILNMINSASTISAPVSKILYACPISSIMPVSPPFP